MSYSGIHRRARRDDLDTINLALARLVEMHERGECSTAEMSAGERVLRQMRNEASPADGTFEAMARDAGVHPNTVRSRMRRGMSFEEALTAPRARKPAQATLELCIKHGIDQGTVKWRLSQGMSLHQALTTPVNKALSPKLTTEQKVQELTGKDAIQALRDLRAQGKAVNVIADLLGTSTHWVCRMIHRHNIPKGATA